MYLRIKIWKFIKDCWKIISSKKAFINKTGKEGYGNDRNTEKYTD